VTALVTGLAMWLWPHKGHHWDSDTWPSAERVANELADLGVTTVIPQAGRDSARQWCTPAHVAAYRAKGIRVLIGLGLDGAAADLVNTTADCINAALSVTHVDGVMLDWEGRWDGKAALGAQVADRVLAAHPDAAERVVDCPWWAPLTTPGEHATHGGAPTVGFGKLAKTRFVQAYGANVPGSPDGASLKMLDWARDTSQYAKIAAKAGVAPWTIMGSFQTYGRSLQDTIDTLLREPTQVLWSWTEMDDQCVIALKAVKALSSRGHTGVGAVRAVQASAGLSVDGKVGPKTVAALGVTL